MLWHPDRNRCPARVSDIRVTARHAIFGAAGRSARSRAARLGVHAGSWRGPASAAGHPESAGPGLFELRRAHRGRFVAGRGVGGRSADRAKPTHQPGVRQRAVQRRPACSLVCNALLQFVDEVGDRSELIQLRRV